MFFEPIHKSKQNKYSVKCSNWDHWWWTNVSNFVFIRQPYQKVCRFHLSFSLVFFAGNLITDQNYEEERGLSLLPKGRVRERFAGLVFRGWRRWDKHRQHQQIILIYHWVLKKTALKCFPTIQYVGPPQYSDKQSIQKASLSKSNTISMINWEKYANAASEQKQYHLPYITQ